MSGDTIEVGMACPVCQPSHPQDAKPVMLTFEADKLYVGTEANLVPLYRAVCPVCGIRSPWACDQLATYFALADMRVEDDEEDDEDDSES